VVLQADGAKGFERPFLSFAATYAGHDKGHHYVFKRRVVGQKPESLKHEPYLVVAVPGKCPVPAAQGLTVNSYVAFVWSGKAADQMCQGRFARA
jgi:hypothetical protein